MLTRITSFITVIAHIYGGIIPLDSSPTFASNMVQCDGLLPQTERVGILRVHNDARSTIARGEFVEGAGRHMPPASNMRQLEWDCELERSSQAWANQCIFRHSGGRGYGENLFMAVGEIEMNPEGLGVNASVVWLNELHKYGWNNLNLTMDAFYSGIGHATQMVWSSKSRLGCASAKCSAGKEVIVVCQYKNSGNVINTNIYDFGEPCSACPGGTECDHVTSLCV